MHVELDDDDDDGIPLEAGVFYALVWNQCFVWLRASKQWWKVTEACARAVMAASQNYRPLPLICSR